MHKIIAGVDEVGVGPIAGPVVAAAVILDPARPIYKLRDSKILTAEVRDILYDRITQRALAISIGSASVEEIDALNIFHASQLAMARAIQGLSLTPTLILIDGRSTPKLDLPMQAIVHGDQTEKPISAASIIAKVTRDRWMKDYHLQFPHYHFGEHKGYSTKKHQRAILDHGICSLHRRSFTFIKNYLQNNLISAQDSSDNNEKSGET